MALTNPLWRGDRQVANASVNAPALKLSAHGSGVAKLRTALRFAGFERTLDPEDLYGEQTRIQVQDFQSLYELKRDGEAGRNTLQKLDDLLNGKIQKRNRKLAPSSSNRIFGKAFAVKYLTETRGWVANALRLCDVASGLIGPQMIRIYTQSEIDAGAAFLFHFRIALNDVAAQLIRKWKYNPSQFLVDDTAAKIAAVEEITSVFRAVHSKLLFPDRNFTDDPAITSDIARCSPSDGIIRFSPTQFVERSAIAPDGMDPRSASWVPIHEFIHPIFGEAGYHKFGPMDVPTENPYSRFDEYYSKNWLGCRTNPDSYAHFAYHANFGRPVLGPYV